MNDFVPSFQLLGLAKYAREQAETAAERDAELWQQIADEIEAHVEQPDTETPDLFGEIA